MKIIASNTLFNQLHDPSLCVIEDGNIIHIEEERLSRVKHGNNDGRINDHIERIVKPDDIVVVVLGYNEIIDPKIYDEYGVDRREYTNKTFSDNKWFMHRGRKTYFVTHHLAHSAYAYYTRPFDKCDIFSCDGWGNETDRYFFNSDLELVDSTAFGVGPMWHYLAKYVFKQDFQSGKLMGLSAYGKVNKNLYKFLTDNIYEFFRLKLDSLPQYEIDNTIGIFSTITDRPDVKELIKLLGAHEFTDIAATVQKITEDMVLDYLTKNRTSSNICLSGGSALNGYINQKLHSIYDNVYIPPACNDSGLSIGAALFVANKESVFKPQDLAYLGNDYYVDELSLFGLNYRKASYEEIYDYTSDKIIDGKIVAWYQGRSESGPRALGNRSILCDPRDPDMKDYLNDRVKHRESFRPFAPAMMKEYIEDWFEDIKSTPYMLKIPKYKPGMGEKVPAVCHIDGTGRVQTVSRESNEHFYNLIKMFHDKTGVPILLNTSFNDKEPIVDSPEDAIKTFNNTNIDVLILKDYIIEK